MGNLRIFSLIIVFGTMYFYEIAQENSPEYIHTIFKKVMDAQTRTDFAFNFDHLFNIVQKNTTIQMPIKYWFWWIPSNITALKLIVIKTAELGLSPFDSYIYVKKLLDLNADPLFEPQQEQFFFYTDKTFSDDIFTLTLLYRNLGALAAILENIYNQKKIYEIIKNLSPSFTIQLKKSGLSIKHIKFASPAITQDIVELLNDFSQVVYQKISLDHAKNRLKTIIQNFAMRDIKSICQQKEKYYLPEVTNKAIKVEAKEILPVPSREIVNSNNYQIFKNILDTTTKTDFLKNFQPLLTLATKHPDLQMSIKIFGTWYKTAITPLKLVVYKTSTLHFTIEDSERYTQQILGAGADPQANPQSSLPTIYNFLFTEGSAIFSEDPIIIAISYNNIGAFKALMEVILKNNTEINIQHIADNVWTYDFRNKNKNNPDYYKTMRPLVRHYAYLIATTAFSPQVKASLHYKGEKDQTEAAINLVIKEAKERETAKLQS